MDAVLTIFAICKEMHIEVERPVTKGRNLVCRGRMGAQPAFSVPDKLFGCQPACACMEGKLEKDNDELEVHTVCANGVDLIYVAKKE